MALENELKGVIHSISGLLGWLVAVCPITIDMGI